MRTHSLITNIERPGMHEWGLSPVAASLATARAVQAHGERIGEVFHNAAVVEATMRHLSEVSKYLAAQSMSSHAAQLEETLAIGFGTLESDRARYKTKELMEALEDARLADALTMPDVGLGTLAVSTTALAIETFPDDIKGSDGHANALEATYVMLEHMPQAWDALTGHPETPMIIVGQVAAQPKLLQ